MKNEEQEYEIVAGLEVHARLLTRSKLFSPESFTYGAAPNTQVSVITLAHPGTLPMTNKEAIRLAIKMGLACHCEIEKKNFFARKNYFYPDLPKGYQVTQHTTPVCRNGFIEINTGKASKQIRITRIHLEEDAGKSIHDTGEKYTNIDLNRAGTALVEIVSEPDIRSGEEAFAYLGELRRLLQYLGISDGNMEEGSLRCDANISVRIKGETTFNTRVEIKNLNSVRNVKRAIETEAARQIALLSEGGIILQQTRSFDDATGKSFPTREKEDAEDYRYFAEPDIPPFHLTYEFIEEIRNEIPELGREKLKRFMDVYSLTEYEAGLLTAERETADYFEALVAGGETHPKSAANWILGPVKAWMNENQEGIAGFPIPAGKLARLISMVDKGRISFTAASGKLLQAMISSPGKEAEELAAGQDLLMESSISELAPIIDEVLSRYAEKVKEYKKGKKGLLSLFVGEVMKRSKGKADPSVTSQLITEKLKSL